MNKKIDKEKLVELEDDTSIYDALKRRAKGYKSIDEVREYVVDENDQEKLIKVKRTEYEVHPDMTALKLLFEQEKENEKIELTEEELLEIKERLIKELAVLDKK